ncbi:MAG: MBL fold metallo-hydrolase [Candidatus Helarchaeota archaeon]
MEIIDKVYSIDSIGFDSNCYIIGKNEITIVDTGASPEYAKFIIEKIRSFGLDISNIHKIIITHRHPDHIGGLKKLLELLSSNSILVYVHKKFITYYKLSNVKGLSDGEILNLDGLLFKIIYTPGHTEDSICLYNEKYKILISGDTVFSFGNIGRVDLPGGNIKNLVKSIEKLAKLDVEFLLPGHMDFVMEGNKHIKQSLQFAKSNLIIYE